MNRIEEVLNKAIEKDPTIKFLFYHDQTDVQDNLKLHIVYNLIRQICQLFPQPLDDKELREKEKEIAKLIRNECLIKQGKILDDWEAPPSPTWLTTGAIVFSKVLALLQPKIEEAFNEGMEKKAELLAQVKTCQDVIKDLRGNLVSYDDGYVNGYADGEALGMSNGIALQTLKIGTLFADNTGTTTFIRKRDNKAGVEECHLIIKAEWQALKGVPAH